LNLFCEKREDLDRGYSVEERPCGMPSGPYLAEEEFELDPMR